MKININKHIRGLHTYVWHGSHRFRIEIINCDLICKPNMAEIVVSIVTTVLSSAATFAPGKGIALVKPAAVTAVTVTPIDSCTFCFKLH